MSEFTLAEKKFNEIKIWKEGWLKFNVEMNMFFMKMMLDYGDLSYYAMS